MSTKIFPCPVCKRKFASMESAIDHVDTEHEYCCPKSITVKQWIFNVKNRLNPFTKYGKSILSGKPTNWNEKLGRYERLADDKERAAFRKLFVQRMMKTHGKATLLNDPEVQKKMLEHRKISGKYVFDDKVFPYTGSYEFDFLRYMDVVLSWDPGDLYMPCPIIVKYISPRDGKEHFYIPDAYIQSLNLIVEIKSQENKHYRKRDLDIELAKDAAMKKLKVNYVKIYDKDYEDFTSMVNALRQ